MPDKFSRILSYVEAMREAFDLCLQNDPNVFLIGEGLPDPKGVFGTTIGLREKYGPDRVMDMPVAENGMTGICIGAALKGLRPIMVHQRVDFAILCFDQIINNAAKWHFMFGGQQSIPLVVRMIVGRGWGQGAQHSQNLQALLAHIPGLKVITPASAYDVKGMLIEAVKDNNPVIFIEDRWLHGVKDRVPEGVYSVPLGKARIVREGKDLTLVASGYMVIEALKAVQVLEQAGIDVELIDLRTVKPLDQKTINQSVQKTKHLLVVDSSWLTNGISAEIVARVTQDLFSELKAAPERLGLPDIPTPSSPGLTKNYYPSYAQISQKVFMMLVQSPAALEKILNSHQPAQPHDVPDLNFTGPF